jgi:hypothetical protein
LLILYKEDFILDNLNEVESNENCGVEVSNTFAGLEDLDAEVVISSVLETTRMSKFQPKRM